MEISRKDQIEFAKGILALEEELNDPGQLKHLKRIVSLVAPWAGANNDVVVYLSEYMYEAVSIAQGEKDSGWKNEFKEKLYTEINSSHAKK